MGTFSWLSWGNWRLLVNGGSAIDTRQAAIVSRLEWVSSHSPRAKKVIWRKAAEKLLRTEFRLGPGIGCGTDARGQFLDGISS